MNLILSNQNLTNPILSYEERRRYRSTGPSNLSHRLKFLKKNIWPRGLFNTIFFLGPQNETALLLQKKVNDDRCQERMRFATETLSLCCLSLLQASLTTWIVSRLSNQWFTDLNSADVPSLPFTNLLHWNRILYGGTVDSEHQHLLNIWT